MATSRSEDAPRGTGFLYAADRLHVATLRARCMVVIVANPKPMEPAYRSVRQADLRADELPLPEAV